MKIQYKRLELRWTSLGHWLFYAESKIAKIHRPGELIDSAFEIIRSVYRLNLRQRQLRNTCWTIMQRCGWQASYKRDDAILTYRKITCGKVCGPISDHTRMGDWKWFNLGVKLFEIPKDY